MYLRKDHAESSIPALRQLIRDQPLGVFTTAISSPNFPLIQCSHIPFVLDVEDESSETELGRLRAHMARQNPHTKAMIESLTSEISNPSGGKVLEQEVMILFTYPIDHYVTPKFYVETKPSTGKVVPTWNYAAAQVYGRATLYFDTKDPETDAFLTKQIHDLSQLGEVNMMGYSGENGRPKPWNVTEAPERYVEVMKKAIIGMEITIDRLEGKFKMSQELSEGDRQGVVKGFAELGTDLGKAMSQIVQERGAK